MSDDHYTCGYCGDTLTDPSEFSIHLDTCRFIEGMKAITPTERSYERTRVFDALSRTTSKSSE